jgi:2,5-diketo-D-gluconate reductase A
MTTPVPRIPLADGRSIPQLGYGVYKVAADEAQGLVETALELGYRHIDTATLYANEAEVGRGVAASGLPRDDVYVTSKLWNADQGYDETLRAFDRSLGLLGFDVLDLYLIHWPVPAQDRYRESWAAMERLRDEGRVRSIGVSNFTPAHLERLAATSDTVPVVNQVELHPWLPQTETRGYDAEHGIVTQGWSPLARNRVLGDAVLARLAAKHDRSPAQIVLRWHIQLGVVVIPKSATPARIAENLDVFDFALDDEDLAAIAGLETGERTGRHPDDA